MLSRNSAASRVLHTTDVSLLKYEFPDPVPRRSEEVGVLHRIRAGAAPLLLDAPLRGPNSGLAGYMWSLECHHVVAWHSSVARSWCPWTPSLWSSLLPRASCHITASPVARRPPLSYAIVRLETAVPLQPVGLVASSRQRCGSCGTAAAGPRTNKYTHNETLLYTRL